MNLFFFFKHRDAYFTIFYLQCYNFMVVYLMLNEWMNWNGMTMMEDGSHRLHIVWCHHYLSQFSMPQHINCIYLLFILYFLICVVYIGKSICYWCWFRFLFNDDPDFNCIENFNIENVNKKHADSRICWTFRYWYMRRLRPIWKIFFYIWRYLNYLVENTSVYIWIFLFLKYWKKNYEENLILQNFLAVYCNRTNCRIVTKGIVRKRQMQSKIETFYNNRLFIESWKQD